MQVTVHFTKCIRPKLTSEQKEQALPEAIQVRKLKGAEDDLQGHGITWTRRDFRA